MRVLPQKGWASETMLLWHISDSLIQALTLWPMGVFGAVQVITQKSYLNRVGHGCPSWPWDVSCGCPNCLRFSVFPVLHILCLKDKWCFISENQNWLQKCLSIFQKPAWPHISEIYVWQKRFPKPGNRQRKDPIKQHTT